MKVTAEPLDYPPFYYQPGVNPLVKRRARVAEKRNWALRRDEEFLREISIEILHYSILPIVNERKAPSRDSR